MEKEMCSFWLNENILENPKIIEILRRFGFSGMMALLRLLELYAVRKKSLSKKNKKPFTFLYDHLILELKMDTKTLKQFLITLNELGLIEIMNKNSIFITLLMKDQKDIFLFD